MTFDLELSKEREQTLTDFTPMKLKSGFAAKIRNMVWKRPRIAPITNAVDAEGIFRLSFFSLTLFGLTGLTHGDLYVVVVLESADEQLRINILKIYNPKLIYYNCIPS